MGLFDDPSATGLSPMMDEVGLAKLFQKVEAGDPQAVKAVQAFRDSPELTRMFTSKAEPMVDELATQLPVELSQGRQNLGAEPSFTPPGGGGVEVQGGEYLHKRPHDWSKILQMASIGFSSLGNAFGGRVKAESPIANMMLQDYQQQQMDQLKRRHSMWDTAYQASQGLPPEVLTDPQFATLAKAKAALDKDMEDRKIDNEKNVSLFLTELARFKPELDTLSLQSRARTQAAGEGVLQGERERLGLAEARDYNFEGTPVTRSEYLQLAKWRRQLEEEIRGRQDIAEANRLSRETTAREGRLGREFAARLASGDRNRAANLRDIQQMGQATRTMIEDAIKRSLIMDENSGRMVIDPAAEQQAYMDNADAIVAAAQAAGINFQEPDSDDPINDFFVINGRKFDARDPQQHLLALKILANMI